MACIRVREAAKNRSFFSGPTTMALPPPLELSGHICFRTFLDLQKKIFFVSGQALTTPPPLSGRATKKIPFFGFPKDRKEITFNKERRHDT